MIRCNSGQLYTGITTDVDRRFAEHQQGKGAKFLRGKGPLELVFTALIGDRSDALKMEIRVKKLRRSEKEALIQRGAMT
nr:GIY-YIG nuclease family protein [Mariprofundus sp. KV]